MGKLPIACAARGHDFHASHSLGWRTVSPVKSVSCTLITLFEKESVLAWYEPCSRSWADSSARLVYGLEMQQHFQGGRSC